MSAIPHLTLDATEVSEILHIDVRTLRRMVSRQQIPPPIRVGDKRILWRVSDIEDFIRNGGTPGMPRRGRPRSGFVPSETPPGPITRPSSPRRGRPRNSVSAAASRLVGDINRDSGVDPDLDTPGPR